MAHGTVVQVQSAGAAVAHQASPGRVRSDRARPGGRSHLGGKRQRALLVCGAAAGPLFVGSVLVQEVTRAGFDPRRHPLSLLSLGDLGWLQITNFVVSGLLVTLGAVGLRRAVRSGRASTWGPRLIGLYGIALVCGGVFLPDAAFGYPVGTPDAAGQMSWHGALHALAPMVAAVALTAACVVFARRFAAAGQRGWAVCTLAAAAADVVLTVASFAAADFRIMFVGGALVWVWASVVTAYPMTTAGRQQ
jgi:hypothetical protein